MGGQHEVCRYGVNFYDFDFGCCQLFLFKRLCQPQIRSDERGGSHLSLHGQVCWRFVRDQIEKEAIIFIRP
jgi:hypothetical protein